jgi:hypothetical protein
MLPQAVHRYRVVTPLTVSAQYGNSITPLGVLVRSWIDKVIVWIRILVFEDCVEGDRLVAVASSLKINQSTKRVRMSHTTNIHGARWGLQPHAAATHQSLGDPLIDACRKHVGEFDGTAKMTRHAAFDDDSLVGHSHLVGTPSPRASQEDQQTRASQNQQQHEFVLVDKSETTRAVLHQRDRRHQTQDRTK